jgi:hypothetical protein
MVSWWLIAGVLVAQADSSPPPERNIVALVRQLDDDDWARRERAEQQLLDLGPDVLSRLPPDDVRLSAETRQRLARVRNRLQVAFARRAVEASRVTLAGPMTVGAALAEIEQATGNKLLGYDDYAEREITVALQNVPFWEALDRVLDLAQLTIYPYDGGEAALRVVPREEGQATRCGQVCYEGIFRIQPTYISASYDITNPVIRGLRVRLALAWEPRTSPIAIALPLDSIAAVDNLGNAISVDGTGGSLHAAVENGSSMVEMQLPLSLPVRAASSIARLEGAFDALVPGQTETFEFDQLDPLRDAEQRRAGVTVRLEELRPNEDVHELHVRVVFDNASNALESHRGWIYKNDAYLLGPQGNRTEYGGRRLLGQDENSILVSYLFAMDAPLTDCKFVYQTPALIIRQPMRFVLQDIALP